MNRRDRRTSGRGIKVNERVRFTCTCGKWASVAKNTAGRDLILHEDPPCEPYLRDRDPNDYLEECRKAMEAKARS